MQPSRFSFLLHLLVQVFIRLKAELRHTFPEHCRSGCTVDHLRYKLSAMSCCFRGFFTGLLVSARSKLEKLSVFPSWLTKSLQLLFQKERDQAKMFISKFHTWLATSLWFCFCLCERRAVGLQPGLVKVWKHEGGYRLMFQNEIHQAHFCIVGLKDSIITICEPPKILVEEVIHDEWIKEFDSPLGFKESFDRFVQRFESDGFTKVCDHGLSGSNNLGDSSILREGSSSGTGNANNSGVEDARDGGVSNGGGPQLTVKDPMHDDKNVKKVEVELILKGKPGDHISTYLYLMCQKKSCCAIESLVNLKFIQKPNENEKLLDVTINTSFKLSDRVVASKLRPASNDERVGIFHDDLLSSYHAEGNLILTKHSADNLSTFDVCTKSTSSTTTGYIIGGEVGLPPAMATAKISEAFSQTFGKGNETSTSMRVDSIQGTTYVVRPYSSPELGQNALSYIAHHDPPLKNLKFEESGLPDIGPSMSMGKTMTFGCNGHFWVLSNSIQRHTFGASRTLGEFQMHPKLCKKWVRQKKLVGQLLTGEQILKRDLLVNHGFSWQLFDGKNFRCALGSTQRDDSYSTPGIGLLMKFP